jgi:site-specific recombinase XerD
LARKEAIMIELVFRSAHVVRRLRGRKLGAAFDDLVAYLSERGHPPSTVRQYVQGVEHFDGWLRRTRRAVETIDETVVDDFLNRHLPRCQCPPPRSTSVHQVRTALRHLVVVLKRTGRLLPSTVETSVGEKLVEEFSAHLRDTRGAADATRAGSARYAREFLADQFDHDKIDFSCIEPSAIVAFFAARGGRWTPGSMKVAATSLRRFFRYLQTIGRADARLVHAVPRIAQWRLASVPRVLTDAQVDALLASFDRSTPLGLRGYATTMCLARLGLRACEVSALTLDDIDWRAGTVTVPATKTRRADVLPLPASVARAILAYLRLGRPAAQTRQIFLRHATPAGAAGPSIVRGAVRRAGARIGLAAALAGPNVLRHTVATRLLRSGATMKDVADVLRHRSIDTASIYAKVDIDTLRKVAAPWPRRMR